ncbi:MAG: C39 family peptidase [Planctomycetota bacterium]
MPSRLTAVVMTLLLAAPVAAWQDLVVHIDDFANGTAAGVQAGDVVTLAGDGTGGFPRRGVWTSPVTAADPTATEILPSWSVQTPPGTGVRLDLRVRLAETDEWSPWLDMGYWGEVPPPATAESFEGGDVAVDIIELDRPADAWQIRATLVAYDLSSSPTLQRISVALRGGEPPVDHGTADWSGDLDVPFLHQGSAGDLIGGSICSPTSVAMALAHFGIDVDLVTHAAETYDREHGIFGNWNRAVARANELGAEAHLEFFDDWQSLADHLKAGRVVVASIRFKKGEAPSFVMNSTAGHLIVLRGLTPDGDVIVNDGAHATEGERAIYKKAEMEKAWFKNAGGVGYVISQ